MKEDRAISKLDQIPVKRPYQAPDGYFDTLADRVLDRVDEPEGGRGVQMSWPLIGSAAAVIALVIVSVLLLRDEAGQKSPEMLLAEVSASDITAYLEYADISDYDILNEMKEISVPDTEESVLPELDLSDEELDLLYEKYGV